MYLADDKCRYLLFRHVQKRGKTFAFFGVNPSYADDKINDNSVSKMVGFCLRNKGRCFFLGNAFAARSTDVRGLKQLTLEQAIGEQNDYAIGRIIEKADILIPCWGNTSKVPKKFRPRFAELDKLLRDSGKPMYILGQTKGGSPLHPLMPGYDTKLIRVTDKIHFS